LKSICQDRVQTWGLGGVNNETQRNVSNCCLALYALHAELALHRNLIIY